VFVDAGLMTNLVAPGLREYTVPDTVMAGPPGMRLELLMICADDGLGVYMLLPMAISGAMISVLTWTEVGAELLS
jgi:hypothetical protein